MHSFIRHAAGTALAIAACAAIARAGVVSGQVVDNNGAGVVGATVDFEGDSVVTGTGGFFVISINDGTYDMTVEPPTTALAPLRQRNLRLVGTVNLGVIRLVRGFVVSGQVRNQGGLPVVGGNIDMIDQATGEELFTPKDGVTATGTFSVVVPRGLFRVEAKPPATAVLVAQAIDNVVVNSAVGVGTIVLPPGVRMTGTVVDGGTNVPIANVDLDVIDAVFGRELVTPRDNTNALGQFSVVVPVSGLLHVRFDPPAGGAVQGLERFNVAVSGPLSLGTVRLPRGFALTGRVLDTSGQPVAGADIDVDTAAAGIRVFTPHDNTDATGRFRVLVPAGNYTVSVEPPVSSGLVGARSAALSVSAATAVPLFSLPAGSLVQGTITGPSGGPEANVDIDVFDPATGVELVTSGDSTDFFGRYAMVLPNGTWDVGVQTAKARLTRSAVLPAVAVAGPRTLDVSLGRVPVGVFLGTNGKPTVGSGNPVPITLALASTSAQTVSTVLSLSMHQPNGNSVALIPPSPFPVAAGTVLVAVNVPLGLPPVLPSLLGMEFSLELRLDEPITGAEIDRDEFSFFIQ